MAQSSSDESECTVSPESTGSVPAPLKVAGALTLLAGLATLAAAGWLATDTVQDPPVNETAGWASVVLLAVFGAAVVVVGRGVLRVSGWSRGPAAVAALLLLAIGSQLTNSVAVALVVAASVITLVMLFLPLSTAAFLAAKRRRADRDGGDATG